jgi:transposase
VLWADRRPAAGGPHVAMASTGGDGRPGDHLWAGLRPLWVVTAQHSDAGPGRQTAGQAAAWLPEWRRHGLVRGRCLPATPPRQWRELARHRTPLGQGRARGMNRVPAGWEEAPSTRAAVVPASRGVPARALPAARIAGHRAVAALAGRARGRRRTTRAHLEEARPGPCTPPQGVRLPESCSQRDDGGDAIARLRAVSTPHLGAEPEAIAGLDPRPGVRQRTAELLLAAIGTARTRFPKAPQLAAWAGMGPGTYERGGTRLRGRTRRGRRGWRQGLVAGAPGAATTQPPARAAPYQRRAARRGTTRALLARGQPMRVSAST